MHRISSDLTLFYKIFLPTFLLVFFGAFTIAAWVVDESILLGMPISWVRILMVSIWLLMALVLYLSVWRLKRVEVDEEYVYATNYFRTYRYPYFNIKKIELRKYFLFYRARLYFVRPTKFGNVIAFLPSRKMFDAALETHPQLAPLVERK